METVKLSRFMKRETWATIWYRFVDELRKDFRHESLLDDTVRPYFVHGIRLGETNRTPIILYAASKFDYGNATRGLSYEENAFFNTLLNMGYLVIGFDYPTVSRKLGKATMNRMLLEAVDRYRPDLLFVVLYGNTLDKQVIREISESAETITLNWFCDDDWRFEDYSQYWAPAFNWVVTTSKTAFKRYQEIGYRTVILAPFACNHWLFKKIDAPYTYDVSFVGYPHGDRRKIIAKLHQLGIKVRTWGLGWPSGRVSLREMVRIFNQSKINLNLSTASEKEVRQIKGRNFEVPGCGGFLLTEYVPGLEDYYVLGKEVACYDGVEDLVGKIKYYLENENERQSIAQAGYERTLRDHTYEKRLSQVFGRVGLNRDSPL